MAASTGSRQVLRTAEYRQDRQSERARFASVVREFSAVVGRHGFERLFVKIENESVSAGRPCACVSDLMPRRSASSNIGRRSSGFLAEKTGSFGRVAVRLQQSRAARAEGAVEHAL